MSLSATQLLEGWEFKPLTEVATVIMGQSPPGSTYNTNGQGLPFFQGKAEFGADHPTPRKWCTAPTRVAEKGDLLMSVRAPVGPTNVADQTCAVGRGLAIIRAHASVPTDLIRHAISLQEGEIASWGTGTTFTAINKAHFGRILIPLPPENLRDDLVALINGTIARRRASSSHLIAARRAIEGFRQSVLAAGCSGRLTADWRLKDGRIDEDHLPARWRNETIKTLAATVPRAIQSGPFGSNLKHSEFRDSGPLVIGIDNVLDGDFTLGSQHRISETKFQELEKYAARPLDVLITVMASVGRVCVIPRDIEPAIITKHVYRITVDQTRVNPRFLMHALRGHPAVLDQIRAQMRGQTRPGINGQIVKGLVVALPPLDEQHLIVRSVDVLLEIAHSAKEHIDESADKLTASSQAVLAKAFRGELTAVPFGASSDGH